MKGIFTARILTRIVITGVIAGIAAGAVVSVFELPLSVVFPIAIALLVGALTSIISGQPKSRSE